MHPRHSKKSIFKEIFAGRGGLDRWRVHESGQFSIFSLCIEETTKKVINFLRKKGHPREKHGYAYDADSGLELSVLGALGL